MALKDTVWGVGIAVDNDNCLAPSSIEEYYLDKGAMFTAQVCRKVAVAAGESIEVEFMQQGAMQGTRLFNIIHSTLCNEFSVTIYELPARDTTDWTRGEGQDYLNYPFFKPNRLNVKEFPVETVRLQAGKSYDIDCWESGESYSVGDYVRHIGDVYKCIDGHTAGADDEPGEGDNWETYWGKVGETIYVNHYILEEGGGPQASDAGVVAERTTQVQMKNSEYNYLVQIQNNEGEGSKDFAIGLVLGVSDFLE